MQNRTQLISAKVEGRPIAADLSAVKDSPATFVAAQFKTNTIEDGKTLQLVVMADPTVDVGHSIIRPVVRSELRQQEEKVLQLENELDELLQLIRREQYLCEVKFVQENEVTTQYTELFAAVYQNNLEAKRYAYLPKPDKVEATKINIRTAKKNLSSPDGSTSDSVPGVQLQLQQQQQQQMQAVIKKKSTLRRPPPVKNDSNLRQPIVVIDADEPNDLISRENIHTLAIDPTQPAGLIGFWDEVVSKNPEKLEYRMPDNRIMQVLTRVTHIEKEAFLEIQKHAEEFHSGLVLDNLPAGFYLQQNVGKLILRYDEAKKKEAAVTPLTLILPPDPDVNPLAELNQFILRVQPANASGAGLRNLLSQNSLHDRYEYARLETYFRKLFFTEGNREDQKISFEFLLDATTKDNIKLREEIQNHLKIMGLKEYYPWLGKVLLHAGPEGVAVLLREIAVLNSNGLGYSFQRTALRNFGRISYEGKYYADNQYLSLISKKGLEYLKQLNSLTPSELTWWHALIDAHTLPKNQNRRDFIELFEAFKFFLNEIKKIGSLPPSCNLVNVKNMKTAMDRILCIVNAADYPDEQLLNLDGLDVSAEGAIYAMRYNGFKLVTKEMKLQPEYRGKNGSYGADLSNLMEIAGTLSPQSFSNLSALVYRYLGTQPQENVFHPFSIYTQLIQMIFDQYATDQIIEPEGIGFALLSKGIDEEAMLPRALLTLLAITGVGPRAFDCSPHEDLKAILEFFDSKVQNLAKVMQSDLHAAEVSYQSAIMAICHQLSAAPLAVRPNLNEFLTFVKEVSLIQGKGSQSVNMERDALVCIASNIKHYGSAIYTIMEIQHQRREIEDLARAKNQDSAIKAMDFYSFNSVLDYCYPYLVGRSETNLREKVKGAFQDDHDRVNLELVNKFITVLALTSNQFGKDQDSMEALVEDIKALANIVTKEFKDPKVADFILNALNDINISKSTRLPTVAEIKGILNELSVMNLSMDRPETAEQITDDLKKKLPFVTFGVEEVTPSFFNIIDLIKEKIAESEFDVQGLLHKVLDDSGTTTSTARTIFKLVSKFESGLEENVRGVAEELFKAQPTLEVFLKHLAGLEKNVRSLDTGSLSKAAINSKISPEKLKALVINEATKFLNAQNDAQQKERIEKAVDQYFTTYKFATLVKIYLEPINENVLQNILTAFHLPDKKFENIILDHLGKIDDSKSIDLAVLPYTQKFEECQSLLNSFVYFKKANEVEFRSGCEIFADHEALLSFPEHTQIIKLFGASLPAPSSTILAMIYQIIANAKNNTQYSTQKFNLAIMELKKLFAMPNLDAEQFKKLLMLSFAHNLTHDHVFPIKELAGFSKIYSVNKAIGKKDSEKLSENILAVIQKTEAANVQSIIHSTEKFISRPETAPRAVNLVNQLLQLSPELAAAEMTQFVSTYENILKDLQDNPILLEQLETILTASGFDESKHVLRDQNKLIIPALNIANVQKLLAGLKTLNERDSQLAEALAKFASYKPAPNFTELFTALFPNGGSIIANEDITKFIENIDRDPKGERVEKTAQDGRILQTRKQIIEKQFSLSSVKDVVLEIKDMLDQDEINPEEQFKLAQQFVYLNALGSTQTIETTTKEKKLLIDFSRHELAELAKKTFVDLKKASGHEKETLQLKLLAILREAIFRATGQVAYSTQMIAVLVSLRQPNNNLLMQLNTGEGKSLVTALLAVMQYAEGQTVDVCTATKTLVGQDYEEKFKKFYDLLGIETAVIHATSPAGTYKVGGINYSTVGDISLYRARAHLENEDLRTLKDKATGAPVIDPTTKKPQKLVNSLVLDEVDYSTLDDRTLFNYAMNPEGDGDYYHNPYAWVYPLINEFIDQEEFLNTDESKGAWSDKEDVSKLHEFLYKRANQAERELLAEIVKKENKLSRWLDAACAAKQLVEDKHFKIQTETLKNPETGVPEEFKTAVPLVKNEPQVGATFSDGVQQFLHARLVKNDTQSKFLIYAEMLFVASESAKECINYYLRQGRVVGISGTPGTKMELQYQQAQFGTKAFSIPPFVPSKLQKDMRMEKNDEAHANAIKDAIESAIEKGKPKTQPIVLFCEDPLKAKKMFNSLFKVEPQEYALAKQHLGLLIKGSVPDNKEKEIEATIVFKQLAKSDGPYKHNKTLRKLLQKLAKLKYAETEKRNKLLTPEAKLILGKLSGDDKLASSIYDIFYKIGTGEYTDKERLKDQDVFNELQNRFAGTKDAEVFKAIATTDPKKLNPNQKKFIKQWTNKLTFFDLQFVDGSEKEKDKKDRIRDAGNANTITITTSLLGRGTDFKPLHPRGLFIIQTYFDTERVEWQIMGRGGRNGKEGRYIVIYNQNDIVHRYDVDFNENNWWLQRQYLQRRIIKESAIERHYIQDVDQIQNIIMRHFDRWQSLAVSLHSKEDNFLKSTVLPIREQLLQALKIKWQEKLAAMQKTGNPYIQKDENGNYVFTKLNAAIEQYEAEVAAIWNVYKAKIAEVGVLDKVHKPEDALTDTSIEYVNSMRYVYLDRLEVIPEIKDRHVAYRKNKQTEKAEKKSTSRILEYALDENRALLAYATTAEEKERFARRASLRQLELVLKDFMNHFYSGLKIPAAKRNEIENTMRSLRTRLEFYLQAEVGDNQNKKITLEQLQECVDDTVKLFIGIDGYFPTLAEKFKIQPLIGNVLSITHELQAYVPNFLVNAVILKLETMFVDDSVTSLLTQLKTSLSWAAKEKRGTLEYKIERTSAQNAAIEILDIITQFENAKDNEKEEAFKQLIKTLERHKLKLDNVFIFALGHENIKKTINKALAIFSTVSRVSGTQFIKTPDELRKEAQTEAVVDENIARFTHERDQIDAAVKKKFSKDQKVQAAWADFMGNIQTILNTNHSLYAFYELQHRLQTAMTQCRDHGVAQLVPHLQKMSQRLKQITVEMEYQHRDSLSIQQLIALKEKQFTAQLEDLRAKKLHWAKFTATSLTINHTGFHEQYELRIECEGLEAARENAFVTTLGMTLHQEASAEANFLNQEITKAKSELESLQTGATDTSPNLTEFIELIQRMESVDPIISSTEFAKIFTFEIQNQFKTIRSLQHLLAAKDVTTLKSTEGLPKLVQLSLQEVKIFDTPNAQYDDLSPQVKQSYDKQKNYMIQLMEDIKALEESIESSKKQTGSWSKASRKFSQTIFGSDQEKLKEKMQKLDAAEQTLLEYLKQERKASLERAKAHAKSALPLLLSKLEDELVKQKDARRVKVIGEKQKQIVFLEKKQTKLKAKKKPVMIKTFSNLKELFNFQARLAEANKKALQPVEHANDFKFAAHPGTGKGQDQVAPAAEVPAAAHTEKNK